jgi:hypothetical protein
LLPLSYCVGLGFRAADCNANYQRAMASGIWLATRDIPQGSASARRPSEANTWRIEHHCLGTMHSTWLIQWGCHVIIYRTRSGVTPRARVAQWGS